MHCAEQASGVTALFLNDAVTFWPMRLVMQKIWPSNLARFTLAPDSCQSVLCRKAVESIFDSEKTNNIK